MPSTTIAPTTLVAPPAAGLTAAAAAASPLSAARAFAVMLGGPLALYAVFASAAASTIRALRARRPPRLAAVAVLGTATAYLRWARPWMRRWGSTDSEVEMALPGDERVANPSVQQTHAVAIDAPAHAVWPWIEQIGQDRGGFYSYTWLENLAGCRMRNADRVHPEWQRRAVGDAVLLHPAAGLKILRLDPGRALVLEGGWSLVVQEDGPKRCRLLARFRAPGGAGGAAYAMLLELPHFLMERKMLATIKHHAEGGA
jgi:hypothetical protein